MAVQILNGPTAWPIDLAEAKLHSRITFTDDDLEIRKIIAAATRYAQNIVRKQLVATRVKQVNDSFPCAYGNVGMFGDTSTSSRPSNCLYLEAGPLANGAAASLESINYLDMTSTPQVMPPADYIVDPSWDPPRITPVYSKLVWPIALPQIASVWAQYLVGYAAPLKADATANTITVSNWPALSVGSTVRFQNSGGALPAPLQEMTDYFVLTAPGGGVYTLSATSGGAVIDITDAGSGTSFLGEIPEGITGWIKLRIGAFYENREELTSGELMPLPYVDRLLDGYRTWEF
jgi:hypothetical protein